MSDRQRDTIARKGFESILHTRTDALERRLLIRWLMDKIDQVDMTIRPGPGKELKITKEIVRLILGLPSTSDGRDFIDWYGEVDAASKLRRDLKISKDEFDIVKLQDKLVEGNDNQLSIHYFFLILFNHLLFQPASWGITNNEVLMTENMDCMVNIDWCRLVYTDLCDAASQWHKRSTTNITTTVYGCSLVILVSYFMSITQLNSLYIFFTTIYILICISS